jgi:hypothetical protein
MLLQILATDSNWVPTLARIILGVIFFAHGSQKVLIAGQPGHPATGQQGRSVRGGSQADAARRHSHHDAVRRGTDGEPAGGQ